MPVHAVGRRRDIHYHAAGSVNQLSAVWGFVDDHTFLTKAGHVGVVYRLAGVRGELLNSEDFLEAPLGK